MNQLSKSIFDAENLCQAIAERLSKLSKRNAQLWLIDQQQHLTNRSATIAEKYTAIVSSIKLYTLFQSDNFTSHKSTLLKALKACDGLLIPTRELSNLKYTLCIHLGNAHVAHNMFFEALEYFQQASECEVSSEHAVVSLVNQIRCKLWLRDFRDVIHLMKKIPESARLDPTLAIFVIAPEVRLKLLIGDYKNALIQIAKKLDRNIELSYLKLIAELMQNWETGIYIKYDKFISGVTMSNSAGEFYKFEGLILASIQDLKKGRTISTTVIRKLASLKSNVKDIYLQDCAKVLLLLIKNQNSSLSKKLSLHQRMSMALHQLLMGANDFMYQIASVLWMEYLWNRGQKTEFARYYIEFKGYSERLKFEIPSTLESGHLWLYAQIAEFALKYEKLV